MTDTIFAVTLVTGPGALEHANTLGGRVVTDTDDLQHGDVLALPEVPESWGDMSNRPCKIAENVLLLADGRAPILLSA